MRIAPAGRWDLEEVRNFCFPRAWENRRNLQEARILDELPTLTARDQHGNLVGAALYRLTEQCLCVKKLVSLGWRQDVGLALVRELCRLADESAGELILKMERASETDRFLRSCGFYLKAYFSNHPEDEGSAVIGYWGLMPAAGAVPAYSQQIA